MAGISNVHTLVNGRVPADMNIRKKMRDTLIELAKEHLPDDSQHVWNANIDGVIVQLITSDDHLMDFWVENWFPAPMEGIQPHGRIYAVTGVEGHEPHAYYHADSKTAIFINTNYYGQCKSWALGIVADIMEMQHDIHSIHGAVVDVGGCGIVIVAPTGTGKSTHSYGLVFNIPNARIHSDDWCYVDYIGGEAFGRASATISERKFYVRTDIVDNFPEFKSIFDRSKLENVGSDYGEIRNSRAMIDPKWIAGPDKFIYTTRLRCAILLRRDEVSPPEVKLGSSEAIKILREGAYTVLPGGGPEELWGETRYEPFYNPYLLVRTRERQKYQIEFFRDLFRHSTCHILNTGVETVEQTQERILRIAKEASQHVLREQQFANNG